MTDHGIETQIRDAIGPEMTARLLRHAGGTQIAVPVRTQ